ncbi:hypothetical protein GQ600_26818 [Phytophthora cactorum]|nr:hypothetical protein GQ600_26818 [Phytophthora cactorum]
MLLGKDPNTSLLRELVETIGAFLCSKSSNLGQIGCDCIGFNCEFLVLRDGAASHDPLDVGSSVHLCREPCRFCWFLRQVQICRNLFSLGGVPRWVVEYLLELRSCLQSGVDVVPLNSINKCFVNVWTKYVEAYLSSPLIETQTLVRLAAVAVSGLTVNPQDTISGHKWSRLRDSSLCLLIPRESSTVGACDVRVPYTLLANIGSLKTLATKAEQDFATALMDMSEMVDSTMFALQPWQSWEVFGACFYAVRINACWCLGTRRDAGRSSAWHADCFGVRKHLVLLLLAHFTTINQLEKSIGVEWLHCSEWRCGAGVDIFFALKDAATDNVVVFVDQRNDNSSRSELSWQAECLPDFLVKEGARLVRGVMNCVSAPNLATYVVPRDCFLLSRDETEQFHGTWPCTPSISINSACKTALKTLLRGSGKEVDEAVEEILKKRKESSEGFSTSEELRSFFKVKRLKVRFDDQNGPLRWKRAARSYIAVFGNMTTISHLTTAQPRDL